MVLAFRCGTLGNHSVRSSKNGNIWAFSSAGRAPGSQSGGQGFDPPKVHQLGEIHKKVNFPELFYADCEHDGRISVDSLFSMV